MNSPHNTLAHRSQSYSLETKPCLFLLSLQAISEHLDESQLHDQFHDQNPGLSILVLLWQYYRVIHLLLVHRLSIIVSKHPDYQVGLLCRFISVNRSAGQNEKLEKYPLCHINIDYRNP